MKDFGHGLRVLVERLVEIRQFLHVYRLRNELGYRVIRWAVAETYIHTMWPEPEFIASMDNVTIAGHTPSCPSTRLLPNFTIARHGCTSFSLFSAFSAADSVTLR
jgi:hypothetical protein